MIKDTAVCCQYYCKTLSLNMHIITNFTKTTKVLNQADESNGKAYTGNGILVSPGMCCNLCVTVIECDCVFSEFKAINHCI